MSENDIDCLFLRFSVIYGHLWKSLYRDKQFLLLAKKEWFDSLNKFTADTLEKAVLYCKRECESPPTLPKFIQFCRKAEPRKLSKISHLGTEKVGSQAVAQRYLKEIHNILHKARIMKN